MARIEMGGRKPAKKIVVKQDMIDFIKNQGMTAALKRAGELKAKGAKGEAEFLEGVRRMYGASRLEAATAKAASGPKMPGKGPLTRMTENAASSTRRKYGTPNKTSKPQMVDATGPNAVKTPATKRVFGGTAQQRAQAAARAGGNLNVNRRTTASSTSTKTAAQKAAETAALKKRRAAAAAAVKRAGGRQV